MLSLSSLHSERDLFNSAVKTVLILLLLCLFHYPPKFEIWVMAISKPFEKNRIVTMNCNLQSIC